ncbi:hypothetical protein L3Q82_026769, partial [Scortum barcoo]
MPSYIILQMQVRRDTLTVSEILKMSDPSQWRYLSTTLNLADFAFRGVRTEILLLNIRKRKE